MMIPPTPPLRRASSWRVAQIIIYLTTVAFSIGTLIGYKSLNGFFGQDLGRCILYATPSISDKDKSLDCTVSFEKASSHRCQFLFFTVTASMVYAIIGGWFFIACTTDAKTRPDETVIQSWKLVVPSLFFTLILATISTVSSSFMSGGLAAFLSSFLSQTMSQHCKTFKNFRPENVTSFLVEVDSYSTLTQIFSWLCTAAWLVSVTVLCCRCCVAADFVTQTENEPDSMNANSSGMNSGERKNWRDSLKRFMPSGSSSIGRSIKESLRNWNSESSLNKTLLQRSLSRKTNSSSPDLPSRITPPMIPLVQYNHATSTVSMSDDCDFESAKNDSLYGSIKESALTIDAPPKNLLD